MGSLHEAVVAPSRADALARDLLPFSRFQDGDAGYAEERRFIESSAGRVFVTVSRPLGAERDKGFVVCHSFAHEQLELAPLDVALARRAAAAGFPTMRFHARGYGDSGGDFADVMPSDFVDDAVSVGRDLLGSTGGGSVIPIGVRFGAAIAIAAAVELKSTAVVLLDPAVEPGRFIDSLLKVYARTRISIDHDDPGDMRSTTDRLRESLLAGEELDLFGYPLTTAHYRAAHEMHPLEGLPSTLRNALIVVVNPRDRRDAAATQKRLAAGGIRVRIDDVAGLGRADLGLGAPSGGHIAKRYGSLLEDFVRRILGWAEALP